MHNDKRWVNIVVDDNRFQFGGDYFTILEELDTVSKGHIGVDLAKGRDYGVLPVSDILGNVKSIEFK